jgi:putative peptide zinc metalloprotease protein
MTIPDCPPGPLGSWVEPHSETCRDGRVYRLLVNHRTHRVIELTGAEANTCGLLNQGQSPDASPETAEFLAELHEQGFLGSDPPDQPGRASLNLSLAQLDLRWTGVGRLVRVAHDRGARHLFRPASVAAQIAVALAGLAAVVAALVSGRTLQLRIHPAQIPVVVAVSLAAVAIHELAHALVVVHHGRTVDAAGVRIHLGTPAFYVESADAVMLTRRQRMVQAAAGMWAEWLFTSAVAVWLWCCPMSLAGPLLHRFVILNAATIGTNLIPFTGLDGSWLLADVLGRPDLPRRARGAVRRLLITLSGRQRVAREDRALAAYSAANSLAAAGLLVTSIFFWYQLFGDLISTALHHGPLGWLALAAGATVLGRPAIISVAALVPAAGRAARELYAATTFRWQWRWRIPATHRLATLPQMTGLSGAQLGVLAGHLRRTRCRGSLPPLLATTYGVVTAGSVIRATGSGQPQMCLAGSVWIPGHQPDRPARRATIVHVPAEILRQILGPPEDAPVAVTAR